MAKTDFFNKVSSTSNKLATNVETTVLEDNYLYISHIDQAWCDPDVNSEPNFWILPCSPDSISDSMSSSFGETTALGRTAPVYTYSKSGPRQVQVNLVIHREMMNDVNFGKSNTTLTPGLDYTDSLIKALQSIAVPKYNLTNKAIEPPMVALRLANEVFIKGIVNGPIGLTYNKPILYNNKYAEVSLSLTISEVDPYDAESVFKNGGFRGMVDTFKDFTEGGITHKRMGTWGE